MKKTRRARPPVQLLLLLLLTAGSLFGFKYVSQSFDSPWIYKKDFLQGYLIAKALQAGVDPYLPVPELAQRWMPTTNLTTLKHPTPHTLAIGWLCYPFAWLPYEQAVKAWFIFELVCLAAAVRLLLHGLGVPWSWRRGAALSFFAFAWMPIADDLWYGQFSLFLTVLWLSAWLVLRAGREAQGGALLGLMMALKLVGWPVVLWLAWQRRWRSVGAAALTIGFMHGLAIALHGWPMVRDYYLKYGPLVSAIYRMSDANLSLWTFGARLFLPFGANFTTTPLIAAPLLAQLTGVGLPVIVLAATLWAARRARSFDVGFALLMCASLVLNPIAWTHYLSAASLALALVLQRLQQMDWPRAWVTRLALTVWPCCLPPKLWALITLIITGQAQATGAAFIPFWAVWITALPTFAVLSLCWLLWRLDRLPEQSAAAVPLAFPFDPLEKLSPSAS